MQTQLPRRPYVELPPPPDGLVTAQREGSRRRTRRTVAAFTGGESAVVLVIVAVVLLGGGGGVAVLRPAPVPPATRLPSPGVSKAPALVNGGAHAGTSANPTQRGGHAGLSSLQSPPHSGARVGSTSAAGGRQSSSTVQAAFPARHISCDHDIAGYPIRAASHCPADAEPAVHLNDAHLYTTATISPQPRLGGGRIIRVPAATHRMESIIQ